MQSQKSILKISVILLLVLSNISCDQLSKSIVRKNVAYDETINLVSHYFILTKVENTGAFLSLGNSIPEPFKLILLSILPLFLLIGGLLWLIIRKPVSRVTLTGACFIIGGGIGNIYDRIVYHSVTDFLHMDFVIFRTGIFNMADISITTGVILVMIGNFNSSNTKLTSSHS